MASVSIANAISIAAAAFSLLSTLLIQELLSDPQGTFDSTVTDAKDDTRGDISVILGPIVADAHEKLQEESTDHSHVDLRNDEEAARILIEVIEDHSDNLDVLEDGLGRLDIPEEKFENCQDGRHKAIWSFAISFILGIVNVGVAYFHNGVKIITWLIAAISALLFLIGLYQVYRSWKGLRWLQEEKRPF